MVLTDEQIEQAYAVVVEWLDPELFPNDDRPKLIKDWEPDHGGGPRPTILLEGGPEEWAQDASEECQRELSPLGVWAEAITPYALGLYPL